VDSIKHRGNFNFIRLYGVVDQADSFILTLALLLEPAKSVSGAVLIVSLRP
jgi:hypothetical protein